MWQFLEQSVACLDGPERPTIIRFNDFGNIDELYAVNPSEGSELSTVRGRYRSPSTHIEATIHGDTGMPTLKTTGRFGSTESRLESIAEGVWRSRPTLDFPPGGVLSFSEDASRLTFSSFRTRALPFERVD
jgi:hypothetical protein